MDGGGLGIAELAEIKEIGRDGQATLYAATDLKLARPVTVRMFPPLQNPVDQERFAHQATLLGRFSSHPNVVTMYSTGFTPDHRPYFVTELVSGEHLGQYLNRAGPLPWAVAAALAVNISDGLAQAHSAGVLHRDLRPENVRMAGTTPKLTGFRIPVLDSVNPDGSAADVGAGAVSLHDSPETLAGSLDERSDLYSLASILHQAIDGQAPQWRPAPDTVEAFRLRLANQPAPSLTTPGVPPALIVFVAAALSRDPFDRPQTAAEFADELRIILEGRTTGSLSVLHGPAQRPGAPQDLPSARLRELPDVAVSTASTPATAADSTMALAGGSAFQEPTAASRGAWVAPQDWAPPSEPHTAVYHQANLNQRGPQDPVPPGAMPPVPVIASSQPVRSPVFFAALGLLVLSLGGFLAIIVSSAFGSDDSDLTAPALPDPAALAVVQADGSASITPTAEDGAAMAESTTTIEAMESAPTTETTIARLQVPNLIGEPVESATKALTDAGFQVLVVGRRSANAQPGTVTQQKPDPGDLVTLPRSVTLYIPKASNLPAMVGRSADGVCLELQALGLICNRVDQNSDQVPAGSVIATNPVEGALFSEGSSVALTVSTGPVTNITIPDVSQTSRAEAQAILREAGFTTIAFAMRPSETPQDQVFGSNPPAGSILPSNRPITILISNGQPSAPTVPDVVGKTLDEARTMLADAALNADVIITELAADDPQIGMVITVDPGVGSELEVGATVTLTVGGSTTPTTTVPDSSSSTTEPTDTTTPEESSTTSTTSMTSTTTAESTGTESTAAP